MFNIENKSHRDILIGNGEEAILEFSHTNDRLTTTQTANIKNYTKSHQQT